MLNLENAIALRESGEIRPLMMLEGFFDREELLACAEHDIWTSVHSEHQLALLESTRCRVRSASGSSSTPA